MNYRDQMLQQIAADEINKRKASLSIDKALSNSFIERATNEVQWQREFISDPAPNKALFGERRGGKTTTMAISAIAQALVKPFAQILYVGLTEDSCKRIMYNQILPMLIRTFDLPAKLIGDTEMRFDNGSTIYLFGMDANKRQKEKVRGFKANLILMDEMQSYTQDAKLILKEVLGPTVADTKSSIILGGTAGNAIGKNYWYEITKDNTKDQPISFSINHPEWKVYRCEWANNTAIDEDNNRICDNVRSYLQNEISQHPGIENTPSFRQEWNAEWIIETTALIYRYSPANLLSSPECVEIDTGKRIAAPTQRWLDGATFILGIDLGYNDPTAMTIIGYNLSLSNKLYVIETFQQSEMLIQEVAAKIKQLDSHYHFSYMVGDSSSLQVFESLKQNYSLPIEKANRSGKLSHQLVLNSDLQTRSVVFNPNNNQLIDQLSTCVWDAKELMNGSYVEAAQCKNDLADSFLYAHNFSRHMWYHAPKPKISEADYFTQAIIKNEQMDNRLNRLSSLTDKKRLSPYHINKRT